jgi:hypothetical protein
VVKLLLVVKLLTNAFMPAAFSQLVCLSAASTLCLQLVTYAEPAIAAIRPLAKLVQVDPQAAPIPAALSLSVCMSAASTFVLAVDNMQRLQSQLSSH